MAESFQARSTDSAFARGPDPRVSRLASRMAGQDPEALSAERLAADPARAAALYAGVFGPVGRLLVGLVGTALPTVDWYRVQTAEMGWMACRRLRPDAPPLGPREVGALAPGSRVLVHVPHKSTEGVIVGGLPPADYAGLYKQVSPPIAWGGPTGFLREPFQQHIPLYAYERGGVFDAGIGRPSDETALDRGAIAETGVGYAAGPLEAVLRAGPFAMIRANLFGPSLSVRGYLLKLFSGAHLLDAGDDEGETYLIDGVAAYPWEARGRYESGPYGRAYSEAEQRAQPVAAYDLFEDARDGEPFYRSVAYGGYLGQGYFRAVVSPAPGAAGLRHKAQAEEGDTALFRAAVDRSGGYTLLSAHSIHQGKRSVIVTPRRRYDPPDPRGDDAKAGNYKASGYYGGGAPHQVIDPKAEGAPAFYPVAAVQDFVARQLEKTVYPFVKHRSDFYTPVEGEQAPFPAATAPLDAGRAAQGGATVPPPPIAHRIDHVYGTVEYIPTESGHTHLPEGPQVLREPGGATLTLANGRIVIDAPNGVEIRSGGFLALLAEQVLLRAKRSIDVSATQHDVRIKASRTVQVLAGYGGRGNLHLESRSEGSSQLYRDRIGEEVSGSGVVVKSKGVFGVLAQEAYIRTTERNLTLDAQQGDADVIVCGRSVTTFTDEPVRFAYGAVEGASDVDTVYTFARTQLRLPGSLIAKGKVYSIGPEGGVVTKGNVLAVGSLVCGGSVADRAGGFVGKVDPTFVPELNKALGVIEQALRDETKQLSEYHAAAVVAAYYADGRLGNSQTIDDIAFSFRDDPGLAQYGTSAYETFEPHWLGLAKAGVLAGLPTLPWTEEPVDYQGRPTYPWPGKTPWVDTPTSVRAELTAVDPTTGNAVRGTEGEAGQPRWTLAPPDGTFSTIR